MRAMILAAGRGERMRPLTDTVPKPLLIAGGKPLLQYHIEALCRAGIKDIVINHARFGYLIEDCFGNGSQFGVNLYYSPEGDSPLETGGGIKQALPLLGDEPFLAVNGDIWTDFDFGEICRVPEGWAHLVLVDNPVHNPEGDFGLVEGLVVNASDCQFTYSGIAIFRPGLFADHREKVFSLIPLLREAAENKRVSGQYYQGQWRDIGTPERLGMLNAMLTGQHRQGTNSSRDG